MIIQFKCFTFPRAAELAIPRSDRRKKIAKRMWKLFRKASGRSRWLRTSGF